MYPLPEGCNTFVLNPTDGVPTVVNSIWAVIPAVTLEKFKNVEPLIDELKKVPCAKSMDAVEDANATLTTFPFTGPTTSIEPVTSNEPVNGDIVGVTPDVPSGISGGAGSGSVDLNIDATRLTDGTSIDVDEDNDLVMLYDNSASAMVKVKAQQLHTTEALQWMGL